MNTYIETLDPRVRRSGLLKAYVVTMRPYLMFVSGITGLVGMSFIEELSLAKGILLFFASFLSYGFGQALTDCFQVDTDSISAPYRPLTQGTISKNLVLTISVLGLSFCASVFASYNPVNLFLGMLAALGLATYTPFKRRWWAGPFYNAWIVAVLCVMAFVAGKDGLSQSFAWTLGVVFFGYANFVLVGYFKDINADRATRYRTLPVVFGRKISACCSDVLALLTVAFSIYSIGHIHENFDMKMVSIPAAIFFLAGVIALIVAQRRLHGVDSDDEAHRAISPVVHGYILLLSSVICSQKPQWTAALVAFYIVFNVALRIRPARNQI